MNRTALSIAVVAMFAFVGLSYAEDNIPAAPKGQHAKSVMELDPASVFPTQGPDDGAE